MKPAPVARDIAQPGSASVTVSDEDTNATITLERGQDLFIRLANDRTLRYEWTLVDRDTGALALLGSSFERSLRNADAAEAAGETVWHLRPKGAGSATLNFDLRRPHRLDAPIRSVRYAVKVL